MHSNLLLARPSVNRDEPNEISNMFYSFDNSMVMTGLLNLYKMTKESNVLRLVEKMTQALIERFFDGEKLIPRMDSSFNSIRPTENNGMVKWSTISGAYHCKISLGLLELSRITGKNGYARVSDSLCEYAKKLQKNGGEFITNPGADIIYLHPHLYACEGLIYSGLMQSNESHYKAGLNGIKWAMNQIDYNSNRGLFRDTGKWSIEQSDCTAQLLRILVLCYSELQMTVKKSELRKAIDRLHLQLLDFYIPSGEGCGAMRYQFVRETACSWCTMFSMQALKLWSLKDFGRLQWIDFFI
jgi:hypothetical protein